MVTFDFNYPNQVIYVKVDVLNWEEGEKPIKTVEGLVTGGNLNISGSSIARRTGTLSFVVDEYGKLNNKEVEVQNFDEIESLFSLNKKIKIFLGISKGEEDDIQWFQQGIFIIKNPSLNRSASGLTINLTISDKMCLLNGEMGGSLPAAVTFSEMDVTNDDGTTTKEYPTIKEILTTLLEQYGGITNYEIKDVDDETTKVMKWGLDRTLYKYTFNGSSFVNTVVPEGITKTTEYKYNDIVGFIRVPFTWPGTALTANAGESITSVLDKIKALADYEYFFDESGKFIWQQKKTYVYTNTTSITEKNFFEDNLGNTLKPKLNTNGDSIYTFNNTNLITSMTNTPQYNNIKNDFIIWGKRKAASGSELPIRYRVVFSSELGKGGNNTIENIKEYDISDEIKGYQKYRVNKINSLDELPYKNDKIYYYNENNEIYYYYIDGKYQVLDVAPGTKVSYTTADNYRTKIYLEGTDKGSQYFNSPLYKDLEIEWPKLYDVTSSTRDWRNKEMPKGDEIDYFCHVINVPGLNIEDTGRYQTKVVNDTTVNCIFSPDIPSDILNKVGDTYKESQNEGTNVINVPEDIYNNLYAGGSQNSAFEKARRVINYYTSYNNTISLTTIPIYNLQPNQIIKVEDDESGIHGYYVINTISMPLTFNGTMTISASRALTQDSESGK